MGWGRSMVDRVVGRRSRRRHVARLRGGLAGTETSGHMERWAYWLRACLRADVGQSRVEHPDRSHGVVCGGTGHWRDRRRGCRGGTRTSASVARDLNVYAMSLVSPNDDA